MDFEWCFGTFVPCFGGQTTKGGQEPAKHGIDHTPDPVAMQWPCLPEHKLRTLRTRSVRRASGLVQTALPETGGPFGWFAKPPNDPNRTADRASCGAISGDIGSAGGGTGLFPSTPSLDQNEH
jgi:hypothetical protein